VEKCYIGVDVGGTKCALGLFDSGKTLMDKHAYPSDASLLPEVFFDQLALEVESLLDRNAVRRETVGGVGIGLPSFIKFDEGYLLMTSTLPNLKNFAARDYISGLLGVPVMLDNDANTAALAEYWHGAGRGTRHMLYCAVSTGISNGIIINGAIFRGTYGWAGESGHALITPDEGVMCGCENPGCFMSYVSGGMIVKHIIARIDAGEPTRMLELAGGDKYCISAKHIEQASLAGDEMALWALDKMAYYLGIWLYNLYQILNINCFVFGGGLVKFGPILFDRVRAVFDRYNHIDLPVYFHNAKLGDDFGIIGAVELLFEAYSNGEK